MLKVLMAIAMLAWLGSITVLAVGIWTAPGLTHERLVDTGALLFFVGLFSAVIAVFYASYKQDP